MQPTLTQVPPKRPDSAMATRAPSEAETRPARTPPEPPPIAKRSQSKFSLLQVVEVHLHQVQHRGDVAMLALARDPLLGVLHALGELRARRALDAGEHLRQVAEAFLFGHPPHLPE